jgi:hypothetical protein
MRWLPGFVIACLVAATAVRPLHVERRDTHASRIDIAPSSLAVVARRQASQLPDLRVGPIIVTPAPAVTLPPCVAAAEVQYSSTPVDACAVDAVCARGPPIA